VAELFGLQVIIGTWYWRRREGASL